MEPCILQLQKHSNIRLIIVMITIKQAKHIQCNYSELTCLIFKGINNNIGNEVNAMVAQRSTDDLENIQSHTLDKEDVCEIVCYDAVKINALKGRVEDNEVQGMAQMFKALSDPTRMKMACLLDEGEELCVCDMAILTGQSIATTSHHLRVMKNLGIAKSRKDGKNVFYTLSDHHIRLLVRMTLEHLREEHCHDDAEHRKS